MPRRKATLPDFSELAKAIETLAAERKEIATSLFKEITFLNKQLEEYKKIVANEGVIITGPRGGKWENPALKAYNAALSRYMPLLKQIGDMLPPPAVIPPADPLMDFINSE